jgi:hypothetical protein
MFDLCEYLNCYISTAIAKTIEEHGISVKQFGLALDTMNFHTGFVIPIKMKFDENTIRNIVQDLKNKYLGEDIFDEPFMLILTLLFTQNL